MDIPLPLFPSFQDHVCMTIHSTSCSIFEHCTSTLSSCTCCSAKASANASAITFVVQGIHAGNKRAEQVFNRQALLFFAPLQDYCLPFALPIAPQIVDAHSGVDLFSVQLPYKNNCLLLMLLLFLFCYPIWIKNSTPKKTRFPLSSCLPSLRNFSSQLV
jgi:hypothetical protein